MRRLSIFRKSNAALSSLRDALSHFPTPQTLSTATPTYLRRLPAQLEAISEALPRDSFGLASLSSKDVETLLKHVIAPLVPLVAAARFEPAFEDADVANVVDSDDGHQWTYSTLAPLLEIICALTNASPSCVASDAVVHLAPDHRAVLTAAAAAVASLASNAHIQRATIGVTSLHAVMPTDVARVLTATAHVHHVSVTKSNAASYLRMCRHARAAAAASAVAAADTIPALVAADLGEFRAAAATPHPPGDTSDTDTGDPYADSSAGAACAAQDAISAATAAATILAPIDAALAALRFAVAPTRPPPGNQLGDVRVSVGDIAAVRLPLMAAAADGAAAMVSPPRVGAAVVRGAAVLQRALRDYEHCVAASDDHASADGAGATVDAAAAHAHATLVRVMCRFVILVGALARRVGDVTDALVLVDASLRKARTDRTRDEAAAAAVRRAAGRDVMGSGASGGSGGVDVDDDLVVDTDDHDDADDNADGADVDDDHLVGGIGGTAVATWGGASSSALGVRRSRLRGRAPHTATVGGASGSFGDAFRGASAEGAAAAAHAAEPVWVGAEARCAAAVRTALRVAATSGALLAAVLSIAARAGASAPAAAALVDACGLLARSVTTPLALQSDATAAAAVAAAVAAAAGGAATVQNGLRGSGHGGAPPQSAITAMVVGEPLSRYPAFLVNSVAAVARALPAWCVSPNGVPIALTRSAAAPHTVGPMAPTWTISIPQPPSCAGSDRAVDAGHATPPRARAAALLAAAPHPPTAAAAAALSAIVSALRASRAGARTATPGALIDGILAAATAAPQAWAAAAPRDAAAALAAAAAFRLVDTRGAVIAAAAAATLRAAVAADSGWRGGLDAWYRAALAAVDTFEMRGGVAAVGDGDGGTATSQVADLRARVLALLPGGRPLVATPATVWNGDVLRTLASEAVAARLTAAAGSGVDHALAPVGVASMRVPPAAAAAAAHSAAVWLTAACQPTHTADAAAAAQLGVVADGAAVERHRQVALLLRDVWGAYAAPSARELTVAAVAAAAAMAPVEGSTRSGGGHGASDAAAAAAAGGGCDAMWDGDGVPLGRARAAWCGAVDDSVVPRFVTMLEALGLVVTVAAPGTASLARARGDDDESFSPAHGGAADARMPHRDAWDPEGGGVRAAADGAPNVPLGTSISFGACAAHDTLVVASVASVQAARHGAGAASTVHGDRARAPHADPCDRPVDGAALAAAAVYMVPPTRREMAVGATALGHLGLAYALASLVLAGAASDASVLPHSGAVAPSAAPAVPILSLPPPPDVVSVALTAAVRHAQPPLADHPGIRGTLTRVLMRTAAHLATTPFSPLTAPAASPGSLSGLVANSLAPFAAPGAAAAMSALRVPRAVRAAATSSGVELYSGRVRDARVAWMLVQQRDQIATRDVTIDTSGCATGDGAALTVALLGAAGVPTSHAASDAAGATAAAAAGRFRSLAPHVPTAIGPHRGLVVECADAAQSPHGRALAERQVRAVAAAAVACRAAGAGGAVPLAAAAMVAATARPTDRVATGGADGSSMDTSALEWPAAYTAAAYAQAGGPRAVAGGPLPTPRAPHARDLDVSANGFAWDATALLSGRAFGHVQLLRALGHGVIISSVGAWRGTLIRHASKVAPVSESIHTRAAVGDIVEALGAHGGAKGDLTHLPPSLLGVGRIVVAAAARQGAAAAAHAARADEAAEYARADTLLSERDPATGVADAFGAQGGAAAAAVALRRAAAGDGLEGGARVRGLVVVDASDGTAASMHTGGHTFAARAVPPTPAVTSGVGAHVTASQRRRALRGALGHTIAVVRRDAGRSKATDGRAADDVESETHELVYVDARDGAAADLAALRVGGGKPYGGAV